MTRSNETEPTASLGDARIGTSNGQPTVQADGLRKVYVAGDLRTEALRGVDLAIEPGERVAIMGPSGCGKTTLLNCLSGLETPTGGSVRIEGFDLFAATDDARTLFRAENMGFIFQSFNLLPVLSAVENVELPLLVTGWRPSAARERALASLDLVDLRHRAEHRPREMSGGEQQRVAIARSLVHDPPLVWADEPTGNLDSETSGHVMDLLVRLNEETGKTLVIVTHDPNVAARCHRTVRMASGRIDDDSTNQTKRRGPIGARKVAVSGAKTTTKKTKKKTMKAAKETAGKTPRSGGAVTTASARKRAAGAKTISARKPLKRRRSTE